MNAAHRFAKPYFHSSLHHKYDCTSTSTFVGANGDEDKNVEILLFRTTNAKNWFRPNYSSSSRAIKLITKYSCYTRTCAFAKKRIILVSVVEQSQWEKILRKKNKKQVGRHYIGTSRQKIRKKGSESTQSRNLKRKKMKKITFRGCMGMIRVLTLRVAMFLVFASAIAMRWCSGYTKMGCGGYTRADADTSLTISRTNTSTR